MILGIEKNCTFIKDFNKPSNPECQGWCENKYKDTTEAKTGFFRGLCGYDSKCACIHEEHPKSP